MQTDASDQPHAPDPVLEAVRRYWGFDGLRPLQRDAIRAELDHRDSVVVLPTGGGKSLCYQVPPIVAGRTDIVVSPMISLMKDQVDGLHACGYPAIGVHGGLSAAERNEATKGIVAGRYRLVFVAPERLLAPSFQSVLRHIDVGAFAIDEAHCISHWGHDFRPEYRRLAVLKERFPNASVHAYTATATQRVRRDIAEQLNLREPAMLVGTFDRPNLTYRVVPRLDLDAQVSEVIRRHDDQQAVIVYCLSRKDAERMAEVLRGGGMAARPYHAGLDAAERRRTQTAFAEESLNVVTATVAFGMGIDRSNVRCVIHATMPKSIEAYQQETGRAGRDGLEAECVLFYSAADVMRWASLIRRSAEEAADPEQVIATQTDVLEQMRLFCTSLQCRHAALSEHFGQSYEPENCAACDVCLGEVEGVEDATESARMILSCVARVDEGFGAGYVVDVLVGANKQQIRRRRHDKLSTFALLKESPRKVVQNWVYQLVDQGLLERSDGDRPVLQLNEASWEVMRGGRSVMFMKTKTAPVAKTRAEKQSWEGVNRSLFDHLRDVRREIARERGVPAFVVFSDASLRDMARTVPTSPDAFRRVHGVGEAKLEQFGPRFIQEIKGYQERSGKRLVDGHR